MSPVARLGRGLSRQLLQTLLVAALLLLAIGGAAGSGWAGWSGQGVRTSSAAVPSHPARVAVPARAASSRFGTTSRVAPDAAPTAAPTVRTASALLTRAEHGAPSATINPRAARTAAFPAPVPVGILRSRRGPPGASFSLLQHHGDIDAVVAESPSPGFARGPPSSA